MHGDFVREIKKVHFLTDVWNMRILRILLEQSEGISIKDVADKLKINKGMAKHRLEQFTQNYFCMQSIDIPKYETQRITKSYKKLYMLNPRMRNRLHKFVDIIDDMCQSKIRMTVEKDC